MLLPKPRGTMNARMRKTEAGMEGSGMERDC
jgi:hypothetical protein